MLRGFSASDPRIRHRRLDANGGISANSNEALTLARGEFVILLDHDDVLAPFALFECTRAPNENPAIDLLYSDRDMLDPSGSRISPLFKPQWSPSTLLCGNYLTHATVMRRQLVADVGGFRADFDGAQDWDLFLRISERTGRIAHIPKVLYHWRMSPHSCALSMDNKPYALAAQVRTVQDHLDRTGRRAAVTREPSGDLRVRWKLPDQPSVSLILTSSGLDSLALAERFKVSTKYTKLEVLLVGAVPRERTSTSRFGQDQVRVVPCHPDLTPGARKNLATRLSSGRVLVFADCHLAPSSNGWLEELVGWAMQPEIGVVGTKILRADGKVLHAGVSPALASSRSHYLFQGCDSHEFGVFGSVDWYRDLAAVSGGCVSIARQVFDEVHGFDESLQTADHTIALCHTVRSHGYRVVFTPFATLTEARSENIGPHLAEDGNEGTNVICDPFFSPNLATDSGRPIIRSSRPAWT